MKKIYLLFLTVLFAAFTQAQTTLISPTGDGGFETGATFAANNWTAVNSSTDSWVMGASTTPGASAGTNSAYISSTPAGMPPGWTYSQTNTIQHLYYSVTIPAGDTKGVISFKWKATGEGGTNFDWDNIKVFLVPTSFTPVANIAVAPGYQKFGAGATFGMYKLSSAAFNAETITTPVVAGTTYKLIFSWKSDVSTITNPPGAIDEVSFVSSTDPFGSISSTAMGGLWSSPATWVGGVVPNSGNNVTIPDGSVVVVDQFAAANDLIIGGGTSGILQWNAISNAITVFGNLAVSNGANFNLFTAATAPVTVTANIHGNFTNNGTVHTTFSQLNFPNANGSTLDGSGTFVGGIVNSLFFQNLGNNTINTSQNLITRSFAHTAGTLNTNGKLSIDNTAQFFGQPINQRVYEIVVTAMGSGYNTATPPTVSLAAPTGAGITATATPNIDDATGTLRSITITNAGDGYRANPAVTIAGGTGTGAAAIAVVNILSQGATTSSTQKSGAATITGGINIKSDQAVGNIYTTNGGIGYTSAPQVGAALPNVSYLNLVTAGGSGYITAPTVTVTGGTALAGSTNPMFTVVVAQGKVVSVVSTAGGTLWQVPPTLTITGGGGTGATAEYPAGCLVTATASINNGAVNNFTVTNGGFGYTIAPAIGLVGGGFTTVATTPLSRVGLYNLTLAWFSPAAAPALHTETAVVPANRRINTLTLSNASVGFDLTGDLDLYNSSALSFANGYINLGGNTLTASHPSYAGTTGTATNYITNGTIKLSTIGGSTTRTFPFFPSFVAATGTGSLATGSTVTSLATTRVGAPSGTVNPSGNTIGSRAYRVVTNAGAVYGTNPTVTMNYDAVDALAGTADNPTLFIGQSAALAGPWETRSLTSGAGALPATGTRTTATAAPGPIVPTTDEYYAWVTTYVPPTCAIPTVVTAVAITSNSADISWGGSGTFILEYGPTGFTPGTTNTAGGGTIIAPATSIQAITGLTPATSYDVYVRQDCTASSAGYSPNSIISSFTTLFDCTTLPVISCNTSVTTGNLAVAGGLFTFSGTTGCNFTTPGKEKIYSFTSTIAGTYTLSVTNVNGGTGYNDYLFKIADGNCSVNTGWTCIADINVVGTNTFTLAAATTYYILVDAESAASTANHAFQIDCPSACPAPTAVGTNTITASSANVTWTGTGTFILEYGLTGFTPGTDNTAGVGGTLINPATSAQAITGLTASTAYQVYVRQDCTGASNGYSFNSAVASFTTTAPPPTNDEATGAISLTVGGGCVADPYNNTSATQSVGEPFPNCEGTAGFAGMWYSFVAPASGSVKISCDGTGTLGDTRMALFAATNPADYTTFSIITCDDDNGITNGARSLFYAAGLTPGTTYYIDVDLYSSFSTKGTYCVAVDELAASMISTTAVDCSSDGSVSGLNATYTGWSSLVDATGNLNANVRQTAGTTTGYSSFKTIKTGAPRVAASSGLPYMNRNFTVNATGVTTADLQLFFTDAEVTNLGTALNLLQVSRVPGTVCTPDIVDADAVLAQTASGSANGVSFVQVSTPGFSNFFVRGAAGPLPVAVEYIKGTKQGKVNVIDWKISCSQTASVIIDLERSNDSRSFRSINTENATALRCDQPFDYTDANPAAGINYYRLKLTTPDGVAKYSTIVALTSKEKGFELISVAPNPVRDNAILTLASAKAGKIEIVITDIVGKVVAKQINTVISGSNPINMNFANLAAGTYNITAVNADGEVKVTRFVKY